MHTQGWPEAELEFASHCPVCGGEDRSLLYTGLTDKVFGVAPGKWTLFKCNDCSSAWLDPRPSITSIGAAYESYYTHSSVDHPIVRRKGLIRSFLHDCMNDYRNARHGLQRSPTNSFGRWLVPLIPSLRAAVDAQCRHLPPLPDDGGRVLDIGFGNGGFLRLATEAGWDAEGIDFDARAVENAAAAGLKVMEGGVSALSCLADNTYDVVTLCHVIEHVHEPNRLLKEVFRLLKPEGIVWIDTPNLKSLGHRWFGQHWRDLDPPRHLVLFNYSSLVDSLRLAGFSNAKRYWRGLSVFDVLPVSEALANGADPTKASRNGKPSLGDIIAELREMIVEEEREFITLTAKKSSSQ